MKLSERLAWVVGFPAAIVLALKLGFFGALAGLLLVVALQALAIKFG